MNDNEQMQSAINKAKALYAKEWREKNPSKWREIQNRYWLKKAAQMQEQHNIPNDKKEELP